MYDEFETFVEDPTRQNYRIVHDAVLAEPSYRACELELAELAELCEQGRYRAVLEKVGELMPGCGLSPRVHFFAARAASELGQQDEAEIERFLLTTCLQGLLATGDGSQVKPYLVTHASDEYDVLRSLGLKACWQTLVEGDVGRFDVVFCDDGCEVWFDVTDLFRRGSGQAIRLSRGQRTARTS